MGSYLDKPETTKKSSYDENDYLEIGSSSMQGWRINQEDAHNSIPQLSENTSFFAVYDGHGGSEVAEYCSQKLPEFLKQLDAYKNGNYEEALRQAFMGFDASLLEDTVAEELRQMAKKNPDYEDSEMDEDADDDETAEEIINLHQEASMPLSEVLEKYKGSVDRFAKRTEKTQTQTKKSNESEAAGPSSSSVSCGSSSSSTSHSSKAVAKSNEKSSQPASDNEVSSSSGKSCKNDKRSDDDETSSSSSIAQPNNQTPDSTLVIIPSSSETQNEPNMKPEQSCPETTKTPPQDSEPECSSNGTSEKIVEQTSSDDAISSTRENGEFGNCSSTSATATDAKSKVSKSSSSLEEPDDDYDENDSEDDECDETYRESPTKQPANSDDDSSEDCDEDEKMYDEDEEEELSNEEISGEEDEDDDGLDDAFMNSMETGPGKASGCTAVVALIVGRDLYVANAGDSRCIICRAGKVIEMSMDHKPEDDLEFQRIRKAGGRVTLDGRVNGGLNLSRAIGDHGYKMNKELPAEEQMITALPDLKKITLNEEDEFMVLACDGIWNYMSNEEVIGFVKHRIDSGKMSLTQICEELFHNCLAPNCLGDGTGCDNMTAIIVKFKPSLFQLPAPSSNSEAEKVSKRAYDSEENFVEPCEKKQKIEDDLTPSAVDTSTS